MARTRVCDGDYRILITRADPRVRIHDGFMSSLTGPLVDPRYVQWDGRLLHLRANNMHVVYRIDYRDPVRGLYLAAWPD